MKNLKNLVTLLEKENIEIDAIELAESLWLSKYITKTESDDFSTTTNNPINTPKEKQHSNPKKETSSPPPISKTKIVKQRRKRDASLYPINKTNNKQSLPFRTPLVRTLYKDSDLIYALRHFRQKRNSTQNHKFDEERIADYIAKTGIFRTFYQKGFEKRFSLLFVVDVSESMKIWERLINDFIRGIKNYHIFRETTIYYMPTDNREIKLYRKKGLSGGLNSNWYRNHTKDSITFLLSDMISKAWSSGRVLEELMEWQRYTPLAIIQMLPQRLWNGTKLIDASMGKMSSPKSFSLNSQLYSRAEEILLHEEGNLPELLKIPILNFSEKSLNAYGMMMRSVPNSQISGALFEREDFRGEYQYSKKRLKLNSKERLRNFYRYASTQAKELLELLAVVPLSLPIIKLVQQKLLPQSSQEHLSEVLMSSIIDREQKIDGFYQFYRGTDEEEGVREELILKIGAREAFETIAQLSEIISTHGGVFDFIAFIRAKGNIKGSREFSEVDREFARISLSLLRKMGNNYSYLADKLSNYLEEYEEDSEEIEVIIPRSKRFMMGSNRDKSAQPVHEVIFNYDFEVAKYPVTVGEFRAFVEDTGYETDAEIDNGALIYNNKTWKKRKGVYWDNPSFGQEDNHPVICVSWDDAHAYIEWLNRKTDETYRLPTESEWEFVCRAESDSRWCFGDNKKLLDSYAWHQKNSNRKTHPVGLKQANSWGLYDMHGNIWEWCIDDFKSHYKNSPNNGREYIDRGTKNKTIRGGSWFNKPSSTHSSLRLGFVYSNCYTNLGFRLFKDSSRNKKPLLVDNIPSSNTYEKEVFESMELNISTKETLKLLMEDKEIKKSINSKMVKIMNSLSIDMIQVPNREYEISKYPITIGEYMHFAKENREHLPKWKREGSKNLTDNSPVVGIDRHNIEAYCRWLNREQSEYIYRLGTKEEWEYASTQLHLGDKGFYIIRTLKKR